MLPVTDPAHSESEADQDLPLGRVVSVSGSQAVVLMHTSESNGPVAAAEMGTLIKVETAGSIVLGLISALTVPVPTHDPSEQEMKIIEIEFVGELPRGDAGSLQPFRRGISTYPALGNQVYHASNEILAMAYACDAEEGVKLGTIVQETTIPAMARTDDLLGKHLAVLGSTGTGKSCSVALMLRNILAKTPNAHVVLLDPHREYHPAFKGQAEVVTAENLTLPFWLLTFEEIVEILIGHHTGHEADIETLRELIPLAKARYGANQRRDLRAILSKPEHESAVPSVDTPVPYRISDLIALIDELIGKLELRGELVPLKRLKSRLETISRDPRYAFMFGSLTVQDTMADILGRIFRVPVQGKPITILELAGLPSEIINVVVSVLSRMTFDFATWSGGRIPITLVCEEAHRYAPANEALAFEPTKRALARIAKEGRKYGVSLCVVSQRPAELDTTILSQCATFVCMRLTNERDQEIARARVTDGSASLLDVLPSLATGEAVVFGEGVALPTRIRFDRLPPEAMPRNSTARFSKDWQRDIGDTDLLHGIVERWRSQSLGSSTHDDMFAEPPHEPEMEEVASAASDAPDAPIMADARTAADAPPAVPQDAAMSGAQPSPRPARYEIEPAGPLPQPAPEPAVETQAPEAKTAMDMAREALDRRRAAAQSSEVGSVQAEPEQRQRPESSLRFRPPV